MSRNRLVSPRARIDGGRPLRLRRALAVQRRRAARHAQRVRELEALLAEERRRAQIVAHDLRSPLHAVSVALGLLETDCPAETLRPVRLARASLSRAGALLDDLLQVVAPMQPLAAPRGRAPVSLSDLIAQAAEEARLRFPQRTLHVEEQHRPVWIDADAAQMAQVLDNLISNALLHSPPTAPVSVQVCCQAEEACVSVENAGIIAPEVQSRLFQPLNRGAKSSHPGSLGLGLHIAKRLVDAQSGRIELDCHDARTRFSVFLPRVEAPNRAT